MSIAYIKDNVDYQKVIDEFILKIKQFETAAEKTILLSQSATEDDGLNENFYTYALMHYLVPIMQTTFNKYHMGLSIYLMQGIKHRNKESKNCTKIFGNYHGNLCKSTMN